MVFMLADIVEGTAAPSLLPKLDMHKSSLFCNIAVFVGWAFLRCLPFISDRALYSKEWHRRYEVLNDSFEFYIALWDKPIGPALCRFMEQKMTFNMSGESNT